MQTDFRFPRLHIVDHPLVQHKLSLMRDKNTSTRDFRELLKEIAMLMGFELTRDFPIDYEEIETPLTSFKAPFMKGKKCVIVPVLRAGLGMTDGLLLLMPSARVGHIGLYRDENKMPVEYLVRLPELEDRTFILVDPMLATGNSAAHAVDVLKKRGVPGDHIRFMALVAAPEGVGVCQELHPDVDLYVAALDDHLDENAYIVPGLGDAGAFSAPSKPPSRRAPDLRMQPPRDALRGFHFPLLFGFSIRFHTPSTTLPRKVTYLYLFPESTF